MCQSVAVPASLSPAAATPRSRSPLQLARRRNEASATAGERLTLPPAAKASTASTGTTRSPPSVTVTRAPSLRSRARLLRRHPALPISNGRDQLCERHEKPRRIGDERWLGRVLIKSRMLGHRPERFAALWQPHAEKPQVSQLRLIETLV